MSDGIGCPKCSHLCIERTFLRADEWLSWTSAEHIGEEGGILAEVYSDESPEFTGIRSALKCVGCGQIFVLNANTVKSNTIKVTATWKPVLRPPHNHTPHDRP